MDARMPELPAEKIQNVRHFGWGRQRDSRQTQSHQELSDRMFERFERNGLVWRNLIDSRFPLQIFLVLAQIHYERNRAVRVVDAVEFVHAPREKTNVIPTQGLPFARI